MASKLGTFVNLLKTCVGTGMLTLPSSFKEAGLFGGTIGLLLIAIVSIHCMHLLLKASTELTTRTKKEGLNYEEVMEESLKIGPERLRSFAFVGKLTISSFLVITQFGFCAGYVLFIAENLEQFLKGVFGWHLSVQWIIVILLPLLTLLCFMNKMEHFAIFSSIAIFIQVIGLSIIYYALFQNLSGLNSRKWFVEPSRIPMFFGIAVSAIEGIGVLLPLYIAMKEPKAMGGIFGILNIGMALVTFLYVAMGFLGYLRFGDDLHDSITLMLPTTYFYTSVKLMFAIAIFFSYPLQFNVGFWLFWPWIRERYFEGKQNTFSDVYQCMLKAFFVGLTFLLAAVVPELELIMSLAGSLLSSYLALIFPPLINIFVHWDQRLTDKKWWFYVIAAKDIVIIIIGFFGFITGTYSSVFAIVIKLFSNSATAINSTNTTETDSDANQTVSVSTASNSDLNM